MIKYPKNGCLPKIKFVEFENGSKTIKIKGKIKAKTVEQSYKSDESDQHG